MNSKTQVVAVAVIAVLMLAVGWLLWELRTIGAATSKEMAALQQVVAGFQASTTAENLALKQSIAGLQSENSRQAGALTTTTEGVRVAVEQQTAVLDRTIGKYVPIRLPAEVSEKIAALQARVADTKQWPASRDEINSMIGDVAQVVDQIPPWAEAEVLPKLNSVRWALAVFAAVRDASESADGELGDAISEMERLAEGSPTAASPTAREHLQSGLAGAQKRQLAFMRSTTVATARKALEEGQNMEDAFEALGEFQDADAKELQAKLQTRIQEAEIDSRLATLRNSFAEAGKLQAQPLKQYALNRVYEESVQLQLELLGKGTEVERSVIAAKSIMNDVQREMKQLLQLSAKENEAQIAEKSRKYQQWALKQMANFNSDFDDAKEAARQNKTLPGEKWTEDEFDSVEQAMLDYLAPISEGLLDPPVAELYRQAFAKGWNKLGETKNEEGRLSLAKRAAIKAKNGLETLE